jgi:hypothetical protein
MSAAGSSGWAAGVLLAIVGVWLLLQTLVGSLPSRIIGTFSSSGSAAKSTAASGGATASTSPDSPQGHLSPPLAAPNPGSTITPGTQPTGGYLPYIPPGPARNQAPRLGRDQPRRQHRQPLLAPRPVLMPTATRNQPDADRPSTSKADQARAMSGAAEADRRSQAAYEAGSAGIPAAEHFAGRDDVTELEREAHRMGATERRSERRRARAAGAAGHARAVAGTSGGYLARAGRSVTSHAGQIPTGGGGSWVGVLVGILGVIALYLLLSKANLTTGVIGGISHGLLWLISPSVLPF